MEVFLKTLASITFLLGLGVFWGLASTESSSSKTSFDDDFYHGPDPTDDFDDVD